MKNKRAKRLIKWQVVLLVGMAGVAVVGSLFFRYSKRSFQIGSKASGQEVPFRDQFNSINWTYRQIFDTTDIPIPTSAPGSEIHGVYGPSVVKYGGKYLMFFGISVYCGVYKDSIGLAESNDGINWTFVRYVIEPDARTCQKKPNGEVDWEAFPVGMQYQTNGPEVQVIKDNGSDKLFVFFDSVLWKWPVNFDNNQNPIECNNIGLAIFDTQLNLLYRNNTYLKSSIDNGVHCQSTMQGFKGPSLQWLNNNTTRLWFDKLGQPGNTMVTSLSQLPDTAEISYDQNFPIGGDVDLPSFSFNQDIVVYGWGGRTITARSRNRGQDWSAPWQFLPASGQSWDADRQGSPDLLLERDTCKVKVYYSGNSGYDPDTVDKQHLSVGMAMPSDDRSFNFQRCNLAFNIKLGVGAGESITWNDQVTTTRAQGYHLKITNQQYSGRLEVKVGDFEGKWLSVTSGELFVNPSQIAASAVNQNTCLRVRSSNEEDSPWSNQVCVFVRGE